jgi:dTDP-4-amino-4,6-dideoxygalactose transaminase
MAPLARSQFGRLEAITAQRVEHAGALRRRLAGTPGLTIPENPAAECVYPRLPVVFFDGARRDMTLRRLRAVGFGATGSYPQALIDVTGISDHLAPGVADTPGGRRIAEGMLTLPTHSFVRPKDLDHMAHVVLTAPTPPGR